MSVAKIKPHRLCGRSIFGHALPSGVWGRRGQGSDEGKRSSLAWNSGVVNKEAFQGEDPDNLRRISIGRGGNMGTRASRSDIFIITNLLADNSVVTSFSMCSSNWMYLVAKIGFDTAENEPLKV